MRPLDRLPSIKLKLGFVIVVAIGVTVVSMLILAELGLRLRWGVIPAVVLALIVVQVIARGLTAPLREMAGAAEAMARGEHGQQVAVHGRDEVGRLAQAFNTMSTELEATDRVRRELVANVAHELRTPLAGLQAALENDLDGVQPLDAEALHAQVQRLTRLVEQLLDLSRLESQGVPLHVTELGAGDLLSRVREEALLTAPAGTQVEIAVQPADLRVRGDADRVHQVLANLTENAVRHASDHGRVVLSARRDGDVVELAVTDDGPGIPAADRERVFERFHQLDAARTGGGAGLGLAIARWIVELHGGAIRAETSGPRGCRMVVELPA
ncbi:MAG: HAMP domain-containing protein [Solirubrobacteraceae bacterium]|nr:HAMP domain-containing protein [Solirubrobacteraceae bacterium]